MKTRAIIISGGMLEEEFVLQEWKQHQESGDICFLIGVDSGNLFLYEHHMVPDYIVGDFDSLPEEIVRYYKEETDIPIREFNPVKDATDTEIAVRLALEKECDSLFLYGATGTRLDHVLGNIQVLSIPHGAGVSAEIRDSHNRIRIIEKEANLEKTEMFGPYFSVFPLDGVVEHFFIEGAKYPLTDHVLTPYDSLCVSNQAKEDKVTIRFPKGLVVLMETRDSYNRR